MFKFIVLITVLIFTMGASAACTSTGPTAIATALIEEASPTLTPTSQASVQIRILFIGNSYTFYNDLPGTLEKLMRSGGYQVEVSSSAFGGWSLSEHLASFETIEKIEENDWDYIVLQEKSVVSDPEDEMYPAVRELDRLIQNAGAETILFMTWGRENGLASAGFPDFKSMQVNISNNYINIADELSLSVAPVGTAWQTVITSENNPGLWDNDGSHPNPFGTYLAACVFYALFTGESPEGLAFTAQLPQETARLLQRAAFDTLLNSRWISPSCSSSWRTG